MNMDNIRKMVYTALLISLSIVIPLTFGFLAIQIGPFTATLASHVPMFLSMFLGPLASVMVGIGSGIGFFITKGAYVGARALMHSIVGMSGAYLIQREVSYFKVVISTSFVHGIAEALVVIPFGITFKSILITVGLGTVLHHLVDGILAYGVIRILSRVLKLQLIKNNL
ncbi:ECF transporter S component [Clostridium tetani]|uniref:ECF transporter S component n=2 Tax=Clostridium tetani TaxID=1513 RepID=A0A4Q0VEF2_CLOTA|nr:ECF transporter S component [Clostridium tetani]